MRLILSSILLLTILSKVSFGQDTAKYDYIPYELYMITNKYVYYPQSRELDCRSSIDPYWKIDGTEYDSMYFGLYYSCVSPFPHDTTTEYIAEYFVGQGKNRRIYLNAYNSVLSEEGSKRCLLYDFSLNSGDTLFAYPDNDSAYIIVDSVSYTRIGDKLHKTQHLSFSDITQYNRSSYLSSGVVAIEGYGVPGLPLNYYRLPYFEAGELIRSYCVYGAGIPDTSYKFQVQNGSSYVLNLTCEFLSIDEIENDIIEIVNPVYQDIKIKGLRSGKSFQLINSTGQIVKEGKLVPDESIDVRSAQSGIYYLRLYDNTHSSFVKVLVVHQ